MLFVSLFTVVWLLTVVPWVPFMAVFQGSPRVLLFGFFPSFSVVFFIFIFCSDILAQRSEKNTVEKTPKTVFEKTSLIGLKFRSIGPAQTSGRVSDFAVNPNNFKEYYVAVASGGVWKTVNAGTTYKSVFDNNSAMPNTPFIGVLISWLMLARNSLFA